MKKNDFQKYYDQIGERVYESYEDKTNICHLNGEYYEQLIEHLSFKKIFNGQLLYSILKEDETIDERLLEEAKNLINYELPTDNLYVINILLVDSIYIIIKMIAEKKA